MNSCVADLTQPDDIKGFGIIWVMAMWFTRNSAFGTPIWAHNFSAISSLAQFHSRCLLWGMVVFALAFWMLVLPISMILAQMFPVIVCPAFTSFSYPYRVALSPFYERKTPTLSIFSSIISDFIGVFQSPLIQIFTVAHYQIVSRREGECV